MATKIKGSNVTSSTFIVPGNFQVDGTTTTINSTTLTVDDKNIVLASGAANAAAANGAGLTVDGASASLTYASSGDKFGFNKSLDITGTATATAFSGPLTGNVTGNVSGTAATVTGAAQTNITSVGTLTAVSVSGTSTFGTSGGDTRFNFDGSNQYRITIKNGGNVAGQIGGGGTDDLRFSNAAGSTTMVIKSTNVGIGVASPSRKLELNNGAVGNLVTFTDGVATNFTFKTDSNSVGTFGTEAGSTELAFMVAGSEKVRIDGGGKVGIGTNNPLSALHVAGAVDASAAAAGVHVGMSGNYGAIEMRGSDGGFIDIGTVDDAVDYRGRIMYTHSTNRMSFFTNGAGAAEVQMRNNGNIRLRGNDQRIEMLTNDNDYALGTSGGAAIRFRNQGAGEEIGFETHHGGVQHSEVMNISTHGYVTTAKVPAFLTIGSPTMTAASGGYGYFHSFGNGGQSFNNGNHYNNGTGVFTAPIAGRYIFGGSITRGQSYSGADQLIYISKNGYTGGNVGSNASASQTHDQLYITTVLHLAANDTAAFTYYNGSGTFTITSSTPRNSFWGYLIG